MECVHIDRCERPLMHILYITNGFPYPLTSGYLRHYFLIKELSARHAITLLSIVRNAFRAEHAAAMAPLTRRVMTFRAADKSAGRMRSALRSIRHLAGGEPAVRQMCSAIGEILRQEAFDAVLLSGKQTFPAMRVLGKLPVVADVCDAASTRILGTARHAPATQRPVLFLKYLHLRRVERRLVRRAAHALFASCRDREALIDGPERKVEPFAQVGATGVSPVHGQDARGTRPPCKLFPVPSHGRASVIPNGVDLDFWRRSSPQRGRHTIVFAGRMDFPANADAAVHLIDDIFPLVRRSVGGAKLLIVGGDPPPAVIYAGRQAGVSVTGFVADVRPYLDRATVFAFPMRFGAGIQNKVLEAMAMEVPVVASPLAADGLRTAEGRRPPLHVACDRVHFAELLTQTLVEGVDDPAPDTEAREFVERHFVWKHSGEKLERVIRLVADSTKG